MGIDFLLTELSINCARCTDANIKFGERRASMFDTHAPSTENKKQAKEIKRKRRSSTDLP